MEDRVTINVSGRRYETLSATLRRLPRSLLGDEQRRAPFWDAARGEFFFDRSSSSFEGVLLAYQTGGDACRPTGVPEHTFLEDLRFFGLSEQAERRSGGDGAAPPPPPPPPGGWRGRVGAVVRGAPVAAASAIVTALSVLVYVVATLPQLYPDDPDDPDDPVETDYLWVLFCVELVCVALIAVEVVARLLTASQLSRSLRDPLNILDLVASALFFISTILVVVKTRYSQFAGPNLAAELVGNLARLVRLTRVFRFVRFTSAGRVLMRAAAATAPSLGVILAIWLAAALFFASLLFWLERDVSYTMPSLLDSLYMTVITMTTVGYGDMCPVTAAGRVVSCLCAYTGCVLAALPAAILVVKVAQCSATQKKTESGGQFE